MMRKKSSAQKTIRDIRRATRRHYSAEEKIRIVLEGLRDEAPPTYSQTQPPQQIIDSYTELITVSRINYSLRINWPVLLLLTQ